MHWYVVTSQKEARIFTKTSDPQQLKLLKVLPNPLGKEKRRALIRKQAGRGVKSIGRTGSVHYSLPKRHDPHDDAAFQFVKKILQTLEKEKFKGNFDSLTVVAEPHLLGKIKTEMKSNLQKIVAAWIKKDLQKTPKAKLTDFLLSKKDKSASTRSLPIR